MTVQGSNGEKGFEGRINFVADVTVTVGEITGLALDSQTLAKREEEGGGVNDR